MNLDNLSPSAIDALTFAVSIIDAHPPVALAHAVYQDGFDPLIVSIYEPTNSLVCPVDKLNTKCIIALVLFDYVSDYIGVKK